MGKLVLGYARHGKDTFAEQYCTVNTGITYASSSLFCAELFIREAMGYRTVEQCYGDRFNHRAAWHELIARYNRDDPARLARAMFAAHDMYIGMRAKREIVATLKAGLVDMIYWVDASKRLPAEGAESMDFGLNWLIDCPARNCPILVVDNNGTYMRADRCIE